MSGEPAGSRFAIFFIPILCLVALLAWALGWNGLGNLITGNNVSLELRHVVREQRQPRVRVADLTKFEWDQLYLYSGYDFNEEICVDLSLTWWECANLPPEEDHDGTQKLVFLLAGRVVHSENGSIYDGDFEELPDSPLTPSSAVFAVRQEGTLGLDADPRYVLSQVKAATAH